jgi:hypothetical protein
VDHAGGSTGLFVDLLDLLKVRPGGQSGAFARQQKERAQRDEHRAGDPP